MSQETEPPEFIDKHLRQIVDQQDIAMDEVIQGIRDDFRVEAGERCYDPQFPSSTFNELGRLAGEESPDEDRLYYFSVGKLVGNAVEEAASLPSVLDPDITDHVVITDQGERYLDGKTEYISAAAEYLESLEDTGHFEGDVEWIIHGMEDAYADHLDRDRTTEEQQRLEELVS